MLFYYKYKVVVLVCLVGLVLVVQEIFDQVLLICKVWCFNCGEWCVWCLLILVYDSLQLDINGMVMVDIVDVYNGVLDYYEWVLFGKCEMLVFYNSYVVYQKGFVYGDIFKSCFINFDLLCYELYCVWVVEVILCKGFSYFYVKCCFYFDEDSWQIFVVDIYDKDGVLIWVQEVYLINYYDVLLVFSILEVIYDFKGGCYFVDGLDNNELMYDFGVQVGLCDFILQVLCWEGN